MVNSRFWIRQKPVNTWDGYAGRNNMFLIGEAFQQGTAVKVFRHGTAQIASSAILV